MRSAESVILDYNFREITQVGVDDRGRISLSKALQAMEVLLTKAGIDWNFPKGLRFIIYFNDKGQVLLSPMVCVPLARSR